MRAGLGRFFVSHKEKNENFFKNFVDTFFARSKVSIQRAQRSRLEVLTQRRSAALQRVLKP